MTIKKPKRIYDPIWNGHADVDEFEGIIFHNDYGAMTAEEYRAWLLRTRVSAPEKGFAQEYNDRFTIAQYIRNGRAGYHAGDGLGIGNFKYYGIEIVESYDENYVKISDEEFIENENMSLRRGAELFHKWGKKPNRHTVKLHMEFASTSCPHRSWKIHGRSVANVQGYFIERIKDYMSLGKTIEEMIDAENKKGEVNPKMEEKTAFLQNYRWARVYAEPNSKSKEVNSKAKSSSIKASGYAYGEKDKEGNSVWLYIDAGTDSAGYIHSNNFLPYRANEIRRV